MKLKTEDMKNSFLLRGLDLASVSPETLEKLNERISKKIESAEYFARRPFEKQSDSIDEDCWIMSVNGKATYVDFPNGGYDSEEQANIALALWKAKTNLDYQKLYYLSKFIIQGLK